MRLCVLHFFLSPAFLPVLMTADFFYKKGNLNIFAGMKEHEIDLFYFCKSQDLETVMV